jgi:hypothetical protein
MHDATGPQRPPAVYVLPEKSHLALVELRDHMRLMGRLAEPGVAAFEPAVRPHAFAWVFKRIGRDVERVLKSTYWSAEVQERGG